MIVVSSSGLAATTSKPVMMSAGVKTVSVRDSKKYPICISDSDCDSVSEKAKFDHL